MFTCLRLQALMQAHGHTGSGAGVDYDNIHEGLMHNNIVGLKISKKMASFPGHSHCQYLITCSMLHLECSNIGGGNGLGARLAST